jgi:hypothetical protein
VSIHKSHEANANWREREYAMTDRIKEPWGERTPFGQGETWPVRVDQFLEEGVSEDDVDRWVQTASILHSNGDALDVAVSKTAASSACVAGVWTASTKAG